MKQTKFKIPKRKRPLIYLPIILLIGMVMLLQNRCVEEYNPNLKESERLLTIDGSIVREQEEQMVVVSMSSPVDSTQFNPFSNCKVFVTDDQNHVFPFEEKYDGKYSAKIDSSYLQIGAKFKLTVETPDKNTYESDFEEILECAPIDSLYFLEETNYSKNLEKEINGLRLNVDIRTNKELTSFYRWKISDAWEYRSLFHIDEIYNWSNDLEKDIITKIDNKDSLQRCWRFGEQIGIYSSSTLNMSDQGIKRIPLHYIFGDDIRLNVKYSCLVNQYSLNEGAYIYWQNKEVEIAESGGLYFSQPSQSVSNLKNINNDHEVVLGYFWVSSVKQKRIFFDGPLKPYGYAFTCPKDSFIVDNKYNDNPQLRKIYLRDSINWPIYIVYREPVPSEGQVFKETADQFCFDCRLMFGGTINKPDYWQ